MDERNGHLLCDAIVSTDGPLKSFPPLALQFLLFSCASAGMHLSFLASLVRFHSCLSSRSPIAVRRTSGFFVKLNWLSHPSHFFPTLPFLLIQASWKGSGLPPPLATHLSVTRHMGTSLTASRKWPHKPGVRLFTPRGLRRDLCTLLSLSAFSPCGAELDQGLIGNAYTGLIYTILDMHLLHHSLTTHFFQNRNTLTTYPFLQVCLTFTPRWLSFSTRLPFLFLTLSSLLIWLPTTNSTTTISCNSLLIHFYLPTISCYLLDIFFT